ncbi:MAG: IgGFc-binding protein [Acidobacteriota bacterium]
MISLRSGLLLVTLLAMAHVAVAERLHVAWPPSHYGDAELVLFLDEDDGAATVSVSGRDLLWEGEVSGDLATRIPLPSSQRCVDGLDDCILDVELIGGAGSVRAWLQSPGTAGVPDTLLFTAHDAVSVPPPSTWGRHHVLQSFPVSSQFGLSTSFVTILGADEPVELELTRAGDCTSLGAWTLPVGTALTLTCELVGAELSGVELVSEHPVLVLSGNVVAEVPVETPGLSGDYLLDLTPPVDRLVGGTTHLVPALPRAPGLEGRGDLVQVVASEAVLVRVRDDAGGDEQHALAAGEVLEIDTAGDGADRTLRIDADGPVTAWHLTSSRARRGRGDPAAWSLVPRQQWGDGDRFFVPDGYGERQHLVVVSEGGTADGVSLDGAPLTGFLAGPTSELSWTVVDLATPPSGDGALHRLACEQPCAAWLVSFGGFKAQGSVVSSGARPQVIVSGGGEAHALHALGVGEDGRFVVSIGEPLTFFRVTPARDLRLRRLGDLVELSWSTP